MSLAFFMSPGGPPGREVVLRGRSVMLVRKGMLYIFTFIATEEQFPDETKVFEKVINGIRWL